MSRHAVSELNPKGKPEPEEELPEELGMLPGDLVVTDKVEDVLETLDIPADAKKRLLALTPATYTGNAAQQAKTVGQHRLT